MSIACLGWGSLIWKPGILPTVGTWNENGPWLPVEFARQSKKSVISLVLEPGAQPVQALWALLEVGSLREARDALCQRENATSAKSIGYWSTADRTEGEVSRLIGSWAVQRNLDGVVWTALPPKWNGQRGVVPTIEQVLEHLRGLPEESKVAAERYVRKAPPQVRTAYRLRIEAELGWTYSDQITV